MALFVFASALIRLGGVHASLEICKFKTRNAKMNPKTELWGKVMETFSSCAIRCAQDAACHGVAFVKEKKTCFAFDVAYLNMKQSSESKLFLMSCTGETVDGGYEAAPRLGLHFKLHREKTDWNTAGKVCRREGAHLLTLGTRIKHGFFVLKIMDLAGKGVWTSLYRKKFSFTYKWLSGGRYFQWKKNEPSKLWDHCGFLTKYGLTDEDCDDRHSYICEKKV